MKTALVFGVPATVGIVVATVLVIDYRRALGDDWQREVVLHEVLFRILDNDTGGPIYGTRAKCIQPGNDNACTTRKSRQAGVLRINIPLHYLVRRGRWFVLEHTWVPPEDPHLRVFFIHNDYLHQNRTLQLAQLLESNDGSEMTIRMQRRRQQQSGEL